MPGARSFAAAGRAMAARLNSPPLAAAVAALAYFYLLLSVLANHGYDPTYLIKAGQVFADRVLLPPGFFVLPATTGYDGQFYYRLARDPLMRHPEVGIVLDTPPYRHQRILYPLLVKLFSFNRPLFVPPILIAVNLLAIACLAWVAGRYAQAVGLHALWGLLIAFYPGFAITFALDLAEIVTALCLLVGLALTQTRRPLFAALPLLLALFAKETTLPAVAMVLGSTAILYWRSGRLGWRNVGVLLAPILMWGAWQVALRIRWGQFPAVSAGGILGAPGSALVNRIVLNGRLATTGEVIWTVEAGYLACCAGIVLAALASSRVQLPMVLSWVLYCALALFLSDWVWIEGPAFLRALTEWYLVGSIIVLTSRPAWRWLLLASSLGTWLYVYTQTTQFT